MGLPVYNEEGHSNEDEQKCPHAKGSYYGGPDTCNITSKVCLLEVVGLECTTLEEIKKEWAEEEQCSRLE